MSPPAIKQRIWRENNRDRELEISRRASAKLKADPVRYAAHLERCRLRDKARYQSRRAKLKSDPALQLRALERSREYQARKKANRPADWKPKKTGPKPMPPRTPEEKKARQDAYNHLPDVAARRKAFYANRRKDPATAEQVRKAGRDYFLQNKQKVYAYRNARRKTDPQFRISSNLRTYIYQRVGQKNRTGQKRFREFVGCSIDALISYLEFQFQEGMTWENYGKGDGKWSIDHRVPCASYDMTDDAQVKLCFHYTNLQPMWWRENLMKRDRIFEQSKLPI